MRLQILIQRHALPAVHILHTTGSGPASHTKSPDSTIADLLNDVNDLVPLESSDGEWGLEDYVVEVITPTNSSQSYECLHFQHCRAVLKDDDEVIIRALSSEDLRVRRLGGRHQITGDGRHLIDGVAFGKQWLRKMSRPGIVIPPRKKRRLLEADEVGNGELEIDEPLKQILSAADEDLAGTLVLFEGHEDDEEIDEDYEDEGDDQFGETTTQVVVKEDFDDADLESDDDILPFEEDEVEALLEDAADIAQAGDAAVNGVLTRALKRKREMYDDGEDSPDDVFEGFSTPVHNSASQVAYAEVESVEGDSDSMMEEVAAQQEVRRRRNIDDEEDVDEDDDDDKEYDDADETSSSGTSSSSSDSDSDSPAQEDALEQAKKRAMNLISPSKGDSTGKARSSSETTKRDSDATSSSDSDSSSDDSGDTESTTSSGSESEVEDDNATEIMKPITSETLPSQQLPETQRGAAGGIPFHGLPRTKSNNARGKRRKQLNQLKRQGLLPDDADFKALEAYEDAQQHGHVVIAQAIVETQAVGENPKGDQATNGGQSTAPGELPNADCETPAEAIQGEAPIGTDNMDKDETVKEPEVHDSSHAEAQSITDTTPKRARLDLASSRRMLFSSLGLRTPKTPEEEDALRQKLSKSVQHTKPAAPTPKDSPPASGQTQQSAEGHETWKSKLVVSAVECDSPGVVLTPPPFPFRQGWSKGQDNNTTQSKRRLREQDQYYQRGRRSSYQNQEGSFAPDVSTLEYDDQPSLPQDAVEKTRHPEADPKDITLKPDNFDSLPDLDREMLIPGATIAYKELHVDAETNYQPEVSSYRVGQVTQVDDDGTIHLQLDQGSLQSQAKQRTNTGTGVKAYGKFELAPEEEDQDPDSGSREVPFSNMILPKLLKTSRVEVPNSSDAHGIAGEIPPTSSSDERSTFVPESAGQDGFELPPSEKPGISIDAIATPRKQEITDIIKEAGFDSALDEELLQPIAHPSEVLQESNSPPQSQGRYAHRFRRRSPLSEVLNNHPDGRPSSQIDGNHDFKDDQQPPVEPSSPFVHTQETVEYPHISQMEINSSEPIATVQSSSHQDAQKVSPARAVDYSFTVSEQDSAHVDVSDHAEEVSDDDGNDEPSQDRNTGFSLGSEVPQSPSQADVVSSPVAPESLEDSPLQRDSFLGDGYDGQDSSYHDVDTSDEESDLPSLRDITSSQKLKRETRSASKKASPPVPTRKSLRHNKQKKITSLPTSPEVELSSEVAVKSSQSQRAPRLSQIPVGTQVIDLTAFSDQREDDSDTPKGKGTKESRRNGSRKASTKGSKQDSGIGTRRLLTTKKPRSYY